MDRNLGPDTRGTDSRGVSELLSSLPDDITPNVVLHYVALANLTNKRAFQLSLFSKAIFRQVQKRPALMFDAPTLKSAAKERYNEELDYLHDTLLRYEEENIHLETFTFKLIGCFIQNGDHHKCIDLAAKKNLKNLNLIREKDINHLIATLPDSVYGVKSLEKLSLMGWILKYPETTIVMPNLKQLCLHSVNMEWEINEGAIWNCCPSIEHLEIVSCCRDKPTFNFEVHNLGNLKKLAIQFSYATQTLEVTEAQRLESLACSYKSCEYEQGSRFTKIPNLRISEFEVPRYQNLRTLSLDYYNCERMGGIFNCHFSDQFPQLEELSMNTNEALQGIDLRSSSLKKIRLRNMPSLKKVDLDVRSVVLFEFRSTSQMTFDKIPKMSFKGNPRPDGWMSHITIGSNQWRIQCGGEWCWPNLNSGQQQMYAERLSLN